METTADFKAFVFDLDGTLLDTLPDLVVLTNEIMARCGCPPHTYDEVLSYIGNGAAALLRRALPDDAPEELISQAVGLWHDLYDVYGHAQTEPFPGIPETLVQLKARGVRLGVLSNKFDAAARGVVEKHLPGIFDLVRGEGPDVPRKPNPKGLLDMLRDFGVTPGQTAFVGDSPPDMQTAVAAGAFPVGVTWGYKPAEALIDSGAVVLVDSPTELARIFSPDSLPHIMPSR